MFEKSIINYTQPSETQPLKMLDFHSVIHWSKIIYKLIPIHIFVIFGVYGGLKQNVRICENIFWTIAQTHSVFYEYGKK